MLLYEVIAAEAAHEKFGAPPRADCRRPKPVRWHTAAKAE